MAPYKTPLIYLLFFLAAVVARPSPTVKRQGIAANPVCFNKGQGVERSDMISAVAWYCSIFNGDSFSNADTTTWYMTGNYSYGASTYDPVPDFGGKAGMIFVGIYMNGVFGNPYQYNMEEDNCNEKFRWVIDNCNTDTTSAKQGGWIGDANTVFEWILNPNPITDPTPVPPQPGPDQPDSKRSEPKAPSPLPSTTQGGGGMHAEGNA